MDTPKQRSTNEASSSLNVDLSEAARALFNAASVTDTLALVVSLAVETIEGCDYAGIFLLEGQAVVTPVGTDELVSQVDSLQHQFAEGPCLDAISGSLTFYAGDLADDERWPRFGPAATALGVRSVLALPLYSLETFGALNLYAGYPLAFGVIDRARAQLLAALAALALSAAQTHQDSELQALNLYAALDTRELIGQAQGILMQRERINADQAFDMLRRASQQLNVKLREIAQRLVDTGEGPDIGT